MGLKEILQPIVSAALNGRAISQALLEDYIMVVSRLTGDKEEDIKERIKIRTEQIMQEQKAKISDNNESTEAGI
jgi:hypothetical protein